MIKSILESTNGFVSLTENQISFWDMRVKSSENDKTELTCTLLNSIEIHEKQIVGFGKGDQRFIVASANDYFLFELPK